MSLKKQMRFFCFVLVIMFSLAFAAAECEDGHLFSEQIQDESYLKTPATCTEPAEYYYACSVCGESAFIQDSEELDPEIRETLFYSFGEPLGHDWSAGNGICARCSEICTHDIYDGGICTVCGMPCSHYYENGVCTICGLPCVHYYENGVCSICGMPCTHNFNNGVCVICGLPCTHVYQNGVCTVCGTPCTHNYENGVCTICGIACSHSYQNGICSICGLPCTHVYQNGVCTVCGAPCTHNFQNGVCTVCGTPCSHDYQNGVCTICGDACSHSYQNGVCTICGLPCTHVYQNGVCIVCGLICGHDFHNGTCTICGLPCTHVYQNGVCTVCGLICGHDFHNGACTICGLPCTHIYQSSVCTICGLSCVHNFNKTDTSAEYLKTSADCSHPATYYYSCSKCGISSRGTSAEAVFSYGTTGKHVPTDYGYRIFGSIYSKEQLSNSRFSKSLFDSLRTESNLPAHVFKCAVCGKTCSVTMSPKQSEYIVPTCKSTGSEAFIASLEYHENNWDLSLGAEKIYIYTDPLNHVPVLVYDEPVDATCTSSGLSGGRHCAVCGAVYEEQKTISALHHWYDYWYSNGNGTHTAECKRDNCMKKSTQKCQYLKVNINGSIHEICPVCGDCDGCASLAIVRDAASIPLTKKSLPRGELIVRLMKTSFNLNTVPGETLYCFTAAYEYSGSNQSIKNPIQISMPLNISGNVRIVRVDSVKKSKYAEAELTYTEIPSTLSFGLLTFQTDKEGVFLIIAR